MQYIQVKNHRNFLELAWNLSTAWFQLIDITLIMKVTSDTSITPIWSMISQKIRMYKISTWHFLKLYDWIYRYQKYNLRLPDLPKSLVTFPCLFHKQGSPVMFCWQRGAVVDGDPIHMQVATKNNFPRCLMKIRDSTNKTTDHGIPIEIKTYFYRDHRLLVPEIYLALSQKHPINLTSSAYVIRMNHAFSSTAESSDPSNSNHGLAILKVRKEGGINFLLKSMLYLSTTRE